MINDKWAYMPEKLTVSNITEEMSTLRCEYILVENKAIGINPVDWKLINSNPLSWEKGKTPGVDGAGVIVGVGASVDKKLIGKRIAYHQFLEKDGSFAHFIMLNPDRVMEIPDEMSFELAASLPCPMLTAWQSFEKIPSLGHKRVLVAGLGSVNKLQVQFLVEAGYSVEVLSQSISEECANALGISKIFRNTDQLVGGYAAIFDAVSTESATRLASYLKANGHIICIQGRIGLPIYPPFTQTISYHEIALGALHQFGDREDWQRLMSNGEKILQKIIHGNIKVETPAIFNFNDMKKALKHSEKSKQKTVLSVC